MGRSNFPESVALVNTKHNPGFIGEKIELSTVFIPLDPMNKIPWNDSILYKN